MAFRYFTDRDLGKQFASVLREAGVLVQRHDEMFLPDGSDEEWLEYCGKNNLVAVTYDKRIRRRPNERAAVIGNGVRLLVVIGAVPFRDLAQNFVATLPRIEQFLSSREPPFIAKVHRAEPRVRAASPEAPGRIEQWYPK